MLNPVFWSEGVKKGLFIVEQEVNI
jgi:hypothetical protein